MDQNLNKFIGKSSFTINLSPSDVWMLSMTLDTERISSFNCDSFVIIINILAAIRFKLSSSFRLSQSIEANRDNEV